MYRIAICENNMQTCGWMEQTILDFAQSILLTFSVDVYYSAEECLMNYDRYDMMYIDIKLHEMNGLQLCSLIRNQLKDRHVLITLMSRYTFQHEEIVEAAANHYLAKPASKQKIVGTLQKMIDTLTANDADVFVYQYGREKFRIPKRDIHYFRVRYRTVFIKTDTMEDSFTGTLDGVIKELSDDNFIRINRNYLVNYIHIFKVTAHHVELKTGEIFQFGKDRFRELTQKKQEMSEVTARRFLSVRDEK